VQRALSAPGAADGGNARPGYLVAVRDAVFHVDDVPVGVPLIATVRRVGGAGALAIHEAQVRFDGGGDCLRATLTTHAGS
jgi:predicted hotdog family 3-hydroxylacyl-ACP dehydratase